MGVTGMTAETGPGQDPGAERPDEALEPSEPDGHFAIIAFMGHNEYTGYVTEIVKNGQPAYHVDLSEKLWGGNPLAYVEYAATAWFSERPVTEVFVRRQWEALLRAAEERKRREDEWRRAAEQPVPLAAIPQRFGDLLDDEDLDDDETWRGDDDDA
jgi:hypothetical protein